MNKHALGVDLVPTIILISHRFACWIISFDYSTCNPSSTFAFNIWLTGNQDTAAHPLAFRLTSSSEHSVAGFLEHDTLLKTTSNRKIVYRVGIFDQAIVVSCG